jgi:hypothetical protein
MVRLVKKWLGLLTLALVFSSHSAHAQLPTYTWTSIIPENDTRDADLRKYDKDMLREMITNMNETEKVFHHQLSWQEVPIRKLLIAHAPFCEIDYDPLHPLVLTDREKLILKEYLQRGGFLVLGEDVYPYDEDQIATVTQWSVIDYIIKDLPAADHDFVATKIDETHPIYHQYYKTLVPAAERWALGRFPALPDTTLVTYKGHPCAFAYANYFCDGEQWVALPRPFPENTYWIAEDYAMNVNLYIYASMH